MAVDIIRLEKVKFDRILGGPVKIVVNPQEADSRKLMFAVGIFEAGEGLVPHMHPESDEVYYVISGSGTVYAGQERKEIPIEPEMALYIPTGTIHSVKNTGEQKLVIAFFVSPGTEPAKEM
jgi:mannose-6-phosphate isomerase-like protein (cupin superfamily)